MLKFVEDENGHIIKAVQVIDDKDGEIEHGMTIEDIKHCLKVMVDCEVCEECNLYGTTGTDHCEHDCVCGALDIINKYQKIKQILVDCKECDLVNDYALDEIKEVVEDDSN